MSALEPRRSWTDELPDWLSELTQLQLVLAGILAVIVCTLSAYLAPTLRQRAFAGAAQQEDEGLGGGRLLQSTVPIFVLTPVEIVDLVLRDEPEVEDEVEYSEEARIRRQQVRARTLPLSRGGVRSDAVLGAAPVAPSPP